MIPLAQRMAGLGTENAFVVLAEVKQLEAAGRSIVNLSIGDCDFPTPENIRLAAHEAIEAGFTHYSPSPGIPALRDAGARYFARTRGVPVSPEEVVVTPGAKPILFFGMLALIDPGDEVIYPNPGFPIYESVARFAGGVPVALPLREERRFGFDPDELRRRVTDRTRMIILNSPNNPTGSVLTASDLAVVAEVARERDLWVLSDEVYCRYLYEGTHRSIASLPGMRERTILLDSHSKSFAMTGWRLGFAAMPPELAEQVSLLITNSLSCTATFTQVAGVEALDGPQDAVEAMIGTFRTRRDRVVTGLNELPGVRCLTPAGAFYAYPNVTEACRRRGLAGAEELQHRLLREAGVAVLARSCFGPRTEGEQEEYVRLSFATSIEALEEGLKRMALFLG
jgi:aspartate/methionine/tyrosine aminotransferase